MLTRGEGARHGSLSGLAVFDVNLKGVVDMSEAKVEWR